ncbi:MAG: hypothetical protein ACPLPS_02685 [bacterium]
MRKILFLSLFFAVLSFSAPLLELSLSKSKSLLPSLRRNFPKEKLNIVVYPKANPNFVSLNGKPLTGFKNEQELGEILKEKLKTAFKQKNEEISIDSLKITSKGSALNISFAPCNYSQQDFVGKWVAFLTEENGVLLHKKEGKLFIPAGTCYKPIIFDWTPKRKPEKLNLIIAFYDKKGKYVVSKSNEEVERK